MKKIIMAVAAIAMAVSLFAVDFSAHVKITGDVATGKHTMGDNATSDINFFVMDDNNQKDADLLEVHFSGDKAGANFRFFVNDGKVEDADGKKANSASDHAPLLVRGINVWFKPLDMLTVTVGSVSQQLYTERLNWWKVPCGASLAQFKGWDHRWSSYATAEGYGISVDASIPVLGGLAVGGAIAPGASNWLSMSIKKGDKKITPKFAPYGVYAKVQVLDWVSVGAAWRDEGNGSAKIITVGADFGNWGTPYYGFLQGRVYFDDSWGSGHTGDPRLMGIAIDNYVKYNLGFMTIDATIPVVIRGFDKDAKAAGDPSYMTARIRASVPLNALTLNVVVGSDEGFSGTSFGSGSPVAWRLDDKFLETFSIYVNPSVSMNIGACAVSVGAEFAFDNAAENKGTFYWGIPFTAEVSF